MVYILHLNKPLSHSAHYIGFSDNLERRLWHHRRGSGARMLKACNQAGIGYQVAAVMDGDRRLERKLHNCKNTSRYCPICSGEKARKYQPKEKP